MSNTITIKLKADIKDAQKNLQLLENDVIASVNDMKNAQKATSSIYSQISTQSKEYANTVKQLEKDREKINEKAEINKKKHEDRMGVLSREGIDSRTKTVLLKERASLDELVRLKKQKMKELASIGVGVTKNGETIQGPQTKEAYNKQKQDLAKHHSDLNTLEKDRARVIRKMEYEEEAAKVKSIEKQAKIDNTELTKKKAHYKNLHTEKSNDLKAQLQQSKENQAEAEKETARRKKLALTQKQEFTNFDKRIAQAKKEYRQTYINTSATNTYQAAVKKLAHQKNMGAISTEKYKAGLEKEKLSLKKATLAAKENAKAHGNTKNNIVRHLRQIETLVIAYYALSRAYTATIGLGIETNRMMEDNTSGVAALLSANTQMVLSNGQVVNSYEKFVLGQKLAKQTMEDLRVASVDTFATHKQLTQLFQQSIGHTLGMGQAFGTTVDEITKNTIKFTQSMSNIGGSVGMEMQKVQEEVRSMLSGNVSTDSLLAVMLFGNPTEANKAIKEAKTKGPNAVSDMLTNMMKAFEPLKEIQSYSRTLLELEDSWTHMMKELTKPIFEDLKVGAKALAEDIKQNTDSIIKGFKSVYATIKEVIPIVWTLTKAVVAYKALRWTASIYSSVKAWTLYNLTVAKSATRIGLLRKANILLNRTLMLNPFTAWLTTIIAVTAAVYTLKTLADSLYEERTGKRADVRVTSATGSLDTSSKEEEVKEAIRRYEKSINLRIGYISKLREYESGAYDTHITNIKRSYTEIERLNKLLDGSTKKLEETKKRMEDAKLLTRLGIESEVTKEARKYITQAETELEKLNQKLGKYEEELKRLDELGKDQKAIEPIVKKDIQEKQKTITDASAKVNLEIQREELKLLLKKTKIEQDLWVAQQKAMGVEVKQSKLIQFKLTAMKKELDLMTEGEKKQKHQTKMFNEASKHKKAVTDEQAKVIDAQRSLSDYMAGRGKTEEQQDLIKLESLKKELVLLDDKAEKTKKILEIQRLMDEIDEKEIKAFKIEPITLDIRMTGFDDVSNAIAGIGNSMQDLMHINNEYAKDLKKIAKLNLTGVKLEEAKGKASLKSATATVGSYANMAGAMASYYDEDGDRRKKQESLAKALQVTQIAMQIASLFQTVTVETAKTGAYATTALAAALAGPFPMNIAAFASVAAILGSIGIALSGSGRAASAPDYTSTIKDASFGYGGDERQGVSLSDYSGNFDAFIKGLDSASQALEAFGNIGSSIQGQITSLQEGISKYSASGTGDISSYRTTVSGAKKIGLAILTGGATAFETRYKAVYDGQTFRGDSRSEVERKVNEYKNLQVDKAREELLVVIESSLADTLDFSALDFSQIKSLTRDINIDAMEAYDEELNNIALKMKLGTDTATDVARATDILSDSNYAYYQNMEEAIKIVDEALLTSTANWKKWTDSFKNQGELLADMAKDTVSQERTTEIELVEYNSWARNWTGRDYYEKEVEVFTDNIVKVAESFEELHELAAMLESDFDGMTDADSKLVEANKEYLISMGLVEDTIMSLAQANSLIADDIVNQWTEAQARLTSLSDTFRNLGESIEDTISTLLGGSDALDAQDRLIADFWAKQSELDVLLATEGQLSASQEANLTDLIGDVNKLSLEIQKASIGENTNITNELITELGTLQDEMAQREAGLSVQDTIQELQATAIDYLGADSEIVYWLKTLNGSVEDSSYQTYVTEKALEEAYSTVDGSHANGLSYVPFDGYRAELHQGEGVLTKEENNRYLSKPQNNFYPSAPQLQNYASQTSDPEIKELLTKIDKKLGKIELLNKDTRDATEQLAFTG